MIKKKNLFFFVFFFYSTVSWAAGVTGWFCDSCNIGNLAMSEGTIHCQNYSCDESCYFCPDISTNKSIVITGGTRNWVEVCSTSLMYCIDGSPGAC